jgi:hypothetical protein
MLDLDYFAIMQNEFGSYLIFIWQLCTANLEAMRDFFFRDNNCMAFPSMAKPITNDSTKKKNTI